MEHFDTLYHVAEFLPPRDHESLRLVSSFCRQFHNATLKEKFLKYSVEEKARVVEKLKTRSEEFENIVCSELVYAPTVTMSRIAITSPRLAERADVEGLYKKRTAPLAKMLKRLCNTDDEITDVLCNAFGKCEIGFQVELAKTFAFPEDDDPSSWYLIVSVTFYINGPETASFVSKLNQLFEFESEEWLTTPHGSYKTNRTYAYFTRFDFKNEDKLNRVMGNIIRTILGTRTPVRPEELRRLQFSTFENAFCLETQQIIDVWKKTYSDVRPENIRYERGIIFL